MPSDNAETLIFRDPQINLYVKGVESSVSFYKNLFGFLETFRTPKNGTPIHVELRLGGLILGLASIESARAIHGLEVGSGPPRGEVALWTDDVDDAFEKLKAKGARVLSTPHDFIGTVRGAWISDPDGNPIQIVAKRR
jgi:catechol 2,3-dioxygenase-like lactoylglutathione lyase family enzyme